MSVRTVRMSETILKSHKRVINKIDKDQIRLDENKNNEAQIG